jgi:hypothetical protein
LAAGLNLELSDLLEMVAFELRAAQQPQMLRAIGFTQPARINTPAPGGGRVINLLDAVAVA